MAALHALYQRLSSIYTVLAPPSTPTKPDALRLGILGAASIAPFAVIDPVRSHPDVIVSAVAARDRSRAEAYAKKHGIPHVFGSYQEMLDDEGVDVV